MLFGHTFGKSGYVPIEWFNVQPLRLGKDGTFILALLHPAF